MGLGSWCLIYINNNLIIILMLEKIKRLFKSIFVFNNWYLYGIEKLLKNKYTILYTRNGLKIKTRRASTDKGIILEILFDKVYNPKGFEINENDVVIDIGGHIGVFSLYASKFTKNKIFCFEPIKENFTLLNENIRINRKNNIKAYNLAICNQKKIKIFISKENTGGHSIFNKSQYYEVADCISLEKIFEREKIEKCNFLKIDCEGCEYDIIYNLDKKNFEKIDKIVMEFHCIQKNKIYDIIKILEKNNFDIFVKNFMLYAKKCN